MFYEVERCEKLNMLVCVEVLVILLFGLLRDLQSRRIYEYVFISEPDQELDQSFPVPSSPYMTR